METVAKETISAEIQKIAATPMEMRTQLACITAMQMVLKRGGTPDQAKEIIDLMPKEWLVSAFVHMHLSYFT